MTSEKIQFRENAKTGNLGLEKKENGERSKFPGCYDMIQPAMGRDGRYKTGLDENSIAVNNIPDSREREATKERIKNERESLERLTGYDLSGKSSFWDTYFTKVDITKSLDMANPLDRIAYYVIIENKIAAPDLRSTSNVAYKTSKYYVARENEDVSIKVEKKKRELEANVAFVELMKDTEKAIIIGKYLNLPVTSTTPYNNIFEAFQNFLDRDNTLGSIDKFLLAVKKSPEELNIKMIYDDAVKLKVIRHRDGLYQRGNITYGKNPKEALEFLSLAENSGELLSVQDEVELKRKFG